VISIRALPIFPKASFRVSPPAVALDANQLVVLNSSEVDAGALLVPLLGELAPPVELVGSSSLAARQTATGRARQPEDEQSAPELGIMGELLRGRDVAFETEQRC
jgi:hypothetical protein